MSIELDKKIIDAIDKPHLQQIVIKPGTRTPPPTPSPQAMRGLRCNTARLSLKSHYMVGWVVRVGVAEQWNETQHYHFVGFRYRSTQPTFP
ncbi:hypothetical protein [Aphanizomenon flos-aquae]|uniref:hypothetical protein n=2 Tax=Aphanizomenonaceae TaxID=1892259 RepID=UPI0004867DED|nr:hypothetical protein [Aphanizomenon flos-aquae]